MTKGIIVRLNEGLHSELDNKLREKGISKQFFFVKCVELFIEGKLSLEDSSQLSSDSNIEELKKQIAIILERLDKLEGDSKVIALDKTIDTKEVDIVDSIQLSNDSSQELSPNVDNTAESTLSECPNLPLNETEGKTIPNEETKPENEENGENDSLLVDYYDDKKEDKPEPKTKKLTNYDKAVKYIQGMAKGEKVESKAELCKLIGIKSGSFFTDKTKAPKNVELWDNNFDSVAIDDKKTVFVKK